MLDEIEMGLFMPSVDMGIPPKRLSWPVIVTPFLNTALTGSPAISSQVLPSQKGFSLIVVLLLFVVFDCVQQIAFGEHEMRLGAGH